MIGIRAAAPADVPVLLELIRGLADYERAADSVVATEGDLSRSLFGPEACASAVLATLDEEPVGFALWFVNFSTWLARPGLYLEDLFVRPDARGRGVGRALLRALAQLATQRDYGRMDWAVLNWNTPAIGFYRRLGAQELTDWRSYRLTGPALAAVAADPFLATPDEGEAGTVR